MLRRQKAALRESERNTLSIHLQNDTVKGKGYGTRAEQLAIQYAFEVLNMVAVNADTIIKNTRSQHVLEKVGFKAAEKISDDINVCADNVDTSED